MSMLLMFMFLLMFIGATVLTVLYFMDILKYESVFIIMIVLWAIAFLLFVYIIYKFLNEKTSHTLTEDAEAAERAEEAARARERARAEERARIAREDAAFAEYAKILN